MANEEVFRCPECNSVMPDHFPGKECYTKDCFYFKVYAVMPFDDYKDPLQAVAFNMTLEQYQKALLDEAWATRRAAREAMRKAKK